MDTAQEHEKAENLRRAELLDATRWASDFSWQEILQLASYMVLADFPRGAWLCREGRYDRFLYIIVSGSAEVIKESAVHESAVIATLLEGQTLGEMSLIDGEPRSASVRARTDCQVLALSSNAFNHLLDERPRLGNGLLLKIGNLKSSAARSANLPAL